MEQQQFYVKKKEISQELTKKLMSKEKLIDELVELSNILEAKQKEQQRLSSEFWLQIDELRRKINDNKLTIEQEEAKLQQVKDHQTQVDKELFKVTNSLMEIDDNRFKYLEVELPKIMNLRQENSDLQRRVAKKERQRREKQEEKEDNVVEIKEKKEESGLFSCFSR